MNNFQELEKKKLDAYPDSMNRIKRRVDGSMDIYKFVGNIFDLYFPKIVGFMTALLGGDSNSSVPKSKYPNKQ